MQCRYCGKKLWLTSQIWDDSDFCSPGHRRKFQGQLRTVIRVVEEESALCPIGPAGFRCQSLPQPFDRAYSATVCEPPAPHRWAIRLPGVSLAGICEELRLEFCAEAPSEGAPAIGDRRQADQIARLQRVSDLVAGLRAQIEKRRCELAPLNRSKGPAPVIPIKRVV